MISDLGLHLGWSGQISPCEESSAEDTTSSEADAKPHPTLPYLRAATNIVVYALTRSEGLTHKRGQPAWKQLRPQSPLEALQIEEDFTAADDMDLFNVLGASLALVHAPLGSQLEKGVLSLRVDGRFRLESPGDDTSGLLLHNLPAGRHSVELEYGGKLKNLEVDLQGGRVLTVGFSLRSRIFFEQLHLEVYKDQVQVEDWQRRFLDLQVEEMHLEIP